MLERSILYDGRHTKGFSYSTTVSGIANQNLTSTDAINFLRRSDNQYGGKYTSDENGKFVSATGEKMNVYLKIPFQVNGIQVISDALDENSRAIVSLLSTDGSTERAELEYVNGKWIADVNLTDVNNVYVNFVKIKPETTLYVQGLIIGINKAFFEESIENVKLDWQTDLSGRTLPISTFEVTIKTSYTPDIFIAHHKISLYIGSSVYGVFYVNKAEKIDNIVKISCHSATGELENYKFGGTSIRNDDSPVRLSVLTNSVFSNIVPQFSCVIVRETYLSNPDFPFVYGSLGVVSIREFLHTGAIGSCRYVYDNLNGTFYLMPLRKIAYNTTANARAVFYFNNNNTITADIDSKQRISSVSAVYHKWNRGTSEDVTDVYVGEVPYYGTLYVELDKAHTNYVVYAVEESGGQEVRTALDRTVYLPQSGSYYFKLTNPDRYSKIAVTARPVQVSDEPFTSNYYMAVNPDFEYGEIELGDVKIQAQAYPNNIYSTFYNVADLILNRFRTTTAKFTVLYDDIREMSTADCVVYTDSNNKKYKGYIERITTEFDGIATLEVVGGY